MPVSTGPARVRQQRPSMPPSLRLVAGLGLLTLFQHEMTEIGDDIGKEGGPVVRPGAENQIGQHFGHFGRDLTEIGALADQFRLKQIVNVTVNTV